MKYKYFNCDYEMVNFVLDNIDDIEVIEADQAFELDGWYLFYYEDSPG